MILQDLDVGVKITVIHQKVCEKGYVGNYGTFLRQCKSLGESVGMVLRHGKNEKQAEEPPDKISRAGLFKHIWDGLELTPEHLTYILEHYPSVGIIDRCVREFRDIFKHMSIPRLYCYIENYSNCGIKAVESFANGLLNDIEAVENAAGSRLSNGFVEGTNSKVKTIKKTMYGKCGIKLLSAKLMYAKST